MSVYSEIRNFYSKNGFGYGLRKGNNKIAQIYNWNKGKVQRKKYRKSFSPDSCIDSGHHKRKEKKNCIVNFHNYLTLQRCISITYFLIE